MFAHTGCFLVANPPYTVSYDGNGNTGGSVPIDDGLYQENQLITVLSEGELIKIQDGISLLFTGWNTAADGSGTTQAVGSTFTIGSTDVTLFAQWSVIRGTGPAGGLIFYDAGAYYDPPKAGGIWRSPPVIRAQVLYKGVLWDINGGYRHYDGCRVAEYH